jgi:uncharacterized membrane protein
MTTGADAKQRRAITEAIATSASKGQRYSTGTAYANATQQKQFWERALRNHMNHVIPCASNDVAAMMPFWHTPCVLLCSQLFFIVIIIIVIVVTNIIVTIIVVIIIVIVIIIIIIVVITVIVRGGSTRASALTETASV